MSLPLRILLIDDDDRFRQRMTQALSERGQVVTDVDGPLAAKELPEDQSFDGIVTDLKMPGATGLHFVAALCERYTEARVVVLTGYGTIATAVEAMRVGAADYLVKPCQADQLLSVLRGDEQERTEEHLSEEVPSLARLEREHIERVILECGGNISKAARVLGINRRTLHYKLAKFPSRR